MTGLQRFPFARPRPALPCHPTHCPTCGHSIALEVRQGVVREHCAGCARNAQRAELGLPALSYERPVYRLPRTTRKAPTATVLRALVVVPMGARAAKTTNTLACALRKSRAATHNILHELEKAGRISSVKRNISGKSTRLLFVPMTAERAA